MPNDLDDCFTELCPFPAGTFSGREHPCPIARAPGPAPCPYADYCKTEWERPPPNTGKAPLRRVFEASYQAEVAVTLAEPSGSFVLRSEHHFHGKEMFRMSFRRHLYEILDSPAGEAPAEFPADKRCPAITRQTRLGLYVGYIDLRGHYQASPLAFGVLAVPRKLAVDPDAHVIAGNYSPLFGGPAFPCNVYSMQDDRTGGAACAQACMIMVLGMLADRGAKLEGSYTLTQLAYSGDGKIPPKIDKVPDELETRVMADEGVERVFPAKGLRPSRIVHALCQLDVRAAEVRLIPAPGRRQARRRKVLEKLAKRMIECHVQARYPVILGVDGKEWGGREKVGHAVTVVGIRKASVQNREEQFILHDPARQPFLERSTSFCFNACWAYQDKDPALVLIVPTEKAVARSLHSCLTFMKTTRLSLYQTLLQGQSRFYPGVKFDYQFSLEYRKDIHTFLWPVPLGTDDRKRLDLQFNFLKPRYWCLAGYTGRGLRVAWFFPTDGRDEEGWELQLFRNSRGEFVVLRPGGESVPLSLPDVLKSLPRAGRKGADNAG